MEGLRRLGFRGAYDVFVDEATAAQFYGLLPGFHPISTRSQRLPGGRDRVRVVPDIRTLPVPADPVPLAIFGAYDFEAPTADDLNADYYLVGQPLTWVVDPYLSIRGERDPVQFGPSTGYASAIPRPSDLELFLRSQIGYDSPQRKRIQLLTDVLTQPDRELIPMYGLLHRDGPPIVGLLAEALARARTSRADLYASDLVCLVLSDFNSDETRRLRDEIAGIPRRAGLEVELLEPGMRSQPRPLRAALRVVALGGVPHKVFQYIFSQTTLFAAVEGRNSTDLALRLGIPFLNVHGEYDDHPMLADPVLRQLIVDAHGIEPICHEVLRTPEKVETITQNLTNYLLALRSDRRLNALFLDTAEARALKPDVLERGLRAILRHRLPTVANG